MTYRQKNLTAWSLAAAPALVLLALQLWPLGHALKSALSDAAGQWTWAHVARVWADPLFTRGLGYSFFIPVVSVALEAGVGLAMALWFYELRRGRSFWRTVAILPFAVPEIVYLLTMKLVFRQHGYLNSALTGLGADGVGWLEPGSGWMLWVIIAVDAWRVTPVIFLIVLTALEALPASFAEAARLDGASRFQIARYVLTPLVIPALLVAMALRAVDAFRIFATPLVLVGIEPLPVLTSVAYRYQVDAHDPAAANVAALTLAAALLLMTLATVLVARRREGRA